LLVKNFLLIVLNLDPISDRYNLPLTFTYSKQIELIDIKKTLSIFIQRHPMMRCTFHKHEGVPYLEINEHSEIPINIHDLKSLSDEGFLSTMKHMSKEAFDIENGPLLRADILETKNKDILLLVFHHLIFDGASLKLLCEDFELIYKSLKTGETLDPPKHTYVAFQKWQHEWLQSEDGKNSQQYWLKKLSGDIPQLNFPVDNLVANKGSIKGDFLEFSIPNQINDRFKTLANENKCSDFLVWLVAYISFVARYTSQEDIIIGTPSMGRPDVQFDEIIGHFANLVPLRCQFESEDDFSMVLDRFKNDIYEALMHADYPLSELINDLGTSTQRGEQSLIQTSFVWTLTDVLVKKPDSMMGLEVCSHLHEAGEQELTLELLVSENGINGLFKYQTNCFSKQVIKRIQASFLTFIDNISYEPECNLKEINLISTEEQNDLINTLNQTKANYPSDQCIHQLFEQQVNLNPDAIAVVYQEQTLTHQELNQQANQLAHYLIENGAVKPDDFIGVCIDRSLEMMVAIMAILKSGAAYLPLDPSYPKERLQYMIGDSNLSLIIAMEKFSELIYSEGVEQLCIDAESNLNDLSTYSTDNPQITGQSVNDLVYAIYTSGSTGKPKGVMVEHQSLSNLCQWHIEQYEVTDGSIATHLASTGFDAAVWEVWPYLISGAQIQIVSDEVRVSPNHLLKQLKEHKVSHSFIPTALLETCFDLLDDPNAHELKYVLTGGDKLTRPCFSHAQTQLVNNYGPTESTVVTSCYVTEPGSETSPPIGKPVANTRVYVMDKGRALTPYLSTGELYIAGDSLARGYINAPELTSQYFINHKFEDSTQERLYRTGDLVRYLDDGNLEFIGRVDDQVKIRGYRIELGEIEHQLLGQTGINSCVVIVREDQPGEKRIVAYYVSDSDQDESELVLSFQSSLKKQLPDYMLPKSFVRLDQIPETVNGKIDRKALPEPLQNEQTDDYQAPASDVEVKLCHIWTEILNLNKVQVSTSSNFFALGGHSLDLAKLINNIKLKIDIELSYKEVFSAPVLKDLAELIDRKRKKQVLFESLEKFDSESVEEMEW